MTSSQAIRTAAYAALNGNVLHQGNPVKVYDSYADPKESDPFYILLSTQNMVQRNAKSRRPADASLVVQVLSIDDNPIGREVAEGIQDQVDQIINPDNRVDLDTTANGWKIGNTIIQNQGNTEDRRDEKYVYRIITTYGFIIAKT